MKCVICKTGEKAPGKVTVTLQRDETTVLIKDVPAEVCDDCEEYYLSDEISQCVLKQAESAMANHAELEVLQFAALTHRGEKKRNWRKI